MAAKRKKKDGLPRFVQRRVRSDGTEAFRGWFPDGVGGRVWQAPMVDSAEEAHGWALEQRDRRAPMPRGKITLAAAVRAVRDELELKGRKDGTLSWYDSTTKVILAAWREGVLLNSITAEGIQRFITLRGRSVSPASLDHYRRALSKILRWGVAHGHLLLNPLDRVIWPAKADPEVAFYSPEEASELVRLMGQFDAPSAASDARMVRFMLATGARRREVAAVTRDDLVRNKLGDFVTIRQTARAGKSRTRHIPFDATPMGQGLFGELREATAKGERLFPGGDDAVSQVFYRWRPGVRRRRGKAGVIETTVPGRLPDRLTVGETAAPGPSGRRRWRFHAHALRHSFVTTLVYGGNHSPLEIQQLAGHRNFETTARYFHLIPGASRRLTSL